MELTFRNLRPDEICAKPVSEENGVRVLLHKDARCDQNILDETVSPTGWQRRHNRDNANCIVSIYDGDKGMWVEKEDTGFAEGYEKEKALASDSFKRACTNWGIGRELYTAPQIFIPVSKMVNYRTDAGKVSCFDKISIANIVYRQKDDNELKEILSVTLKINNELLTFSNEVEEMAVGNNVTQMPVTRTIPISNTPPASAEKTAPTCKTVATTPITESVENLDALLAEDEVILMGNCKGQRYGDCKNTELFKRFLKWVKSSSSNYADPKTKNQFERLKRLAVAVVAA